MGEPIGIVLRARDLRRCRSGAGGGSRTTGPRVARALANVSGDDPVAVSTRVNPAAAARHRPRSRPRPRTRDRHDDEIVSFTCTTSPMKVSLGAKCAACRRPARACSARASLDLADANYEQPARPQHRSERIKGRLPVRILGDVVQNAAAQRTVKRSRRRPRHEIRNLELHVRGPAPPRHVDHLRQKRRFPSPRNLLGQRERMPPRPAATSTIVFRPASSRALSGAWGAPGLGTNQVVGPGEGCVDGSGHSFEHLMAVMWV